MNSRGRDISAAENERRGKNTGTGVPGNGARDKRKEKILRCGKEDISGVYMRERAYF